MIGERAGSGDLEGAVVLREAERPLETTVGLELLVQNVSHR